MIEIAVSLAIIGFALVAIIGVLPIGMNVQQTNREETIINQDATVLMDAIRNGAQGLDDLTNYVMAITNEVRLYTYGSPKPTLIGTYGYTLTNSSMSPQFPLTNGARIVGLLSTPKYMPWTSPKGSGFVSNNVVAYVRSMSGPANEKFPQQNQDMKDFAFSYRMTSEVVPYWTNYYDPSWVQNNAMVINNLRTNLTDVRLVFRWPLRSRGQLGQGGQSFRTLVGGQLLPTLEPGYPARREYTTYFFRPQTYRNANVP